MKIKRILAAVMTVAMIAMANISAMAVGELRTAVNGSKTEEYSLENDYKEGAFAQSYSEGKIKITFTAQLWGYSNKEGYIKLLNGSSKVIMLRYSNKNKNIYLNDENTEIVSKDYASKRINYVIELDFATGDYTVTAEFEAYTKSVSGNAGTGQTINNIAVQGGIKLYNDEISAISSEITPADISEIEIMQFTGEEYEGEATAALFTVTPGSNAVESISVTYEGTILTKDDTTLVGEGSYVCGIIVPAIVTADAFAIEVK